ncbi:MAG: NADH-quinone oxidoreductase subunit NuoG [Pigmentiphaga sp.]|uniref:NADH-quinone oxidoreductase subunit NuoG n=1 Tax=Pigmentiphaga sp. TaxID=1977564 RepID=UPI0029A6642A|nr:NADH-quinone oxidoreductase subunit NuoG [Pigmentiphaga sp.]MDX3905011.1 NADH-quinone oxidoreductase subunit NuoG [Pigmentiphaga sp.]
MVEITIDGKKVEVAEGSMIMHAAQKVGLYVPHFCYHKKLSIAANCRMCLVDVEKAPKPLPACATPVSNGMVVHTASEKAIDAQKGVMEFLLINHPLDCPICDQGGECQLQDLAVGYGGSSSRYSEEKRVVFHKNLGPLVSAEEMARCIHCTRCVRFGQEIAGVMELGMLNRGEHSEITTFVGRAVESELSGNMIDLCPVGALTSKPFRYSARTWELARRKSISPHDSIGANLIIQVKNDRVMRVVPFENEAVNECWISDRDRFSYEGLNSDDRLAAPMVRGADGQWKEVEWAEALDAVAAGLQSVKSNYGAGQIGALAAQYATTEEFALLARLMRALGSDNIDFRLRQTDAGFDAVRNGVPWLGMSLADIATLDRVLVVGSFLRKDHPLLAQRLRQAAKAGTQVVLVDVAADDPLMPLAGRITVAPSALPTVLAEIAVALAQAKQTAVAPELAGVQPGEAAQRIAAVLASGENAAVLLGNLAVQHPQASVLAANAQSIAQTAGARLGFTVEGGNAVGGYLAEAVPVRGGKTVSQMLADPLKAYIVMHAEPALDTDNGVAALRALQSAQFNVALTSYRSAAQDWAHVMLPVSPFTETSGTFVNAEGRVQSFKGTVRPLGQTRPGWKVLRVLGNALELPGFDDETSESVRDAVLAGEIAPRLSNAIGAKPGMGQPVQGLQRVADVPVYFSDAIVRRAESLQATPAADVPEARANSATAASLGLADGDRVRVKSATGSVELFLSLDDTVPAGAVRIAAAHAATFGLGSAFEQLSVERA